MIQIPIEIGDVIRVGKFKNKRITVKEIVKRIIAEEINNTSPEFLLGEKLKKRFKNIKFEFDSESNMWITTDEKLIDLPYSKVQIMLSQLRKSLSEPNLIIHADYDITGFGID